MDAIDVLHQITASSMQAYGMTDLTVGTVTDTAPLRVKVREDMAALPEETLWLTAAVVEKKIPVLTHRHITSGFRHSHGLPDLSHRHRLPTLSHSHSAAGEETGPALSGALETESAQDRPFQSETALEQDDFLSEEALGSIICYENGQPLPVKDGYIILNRGLEAGDKVLMLRVMRGQQFIILSRIFEGGAQSAAKI